MYTLKIPANGQQSVQGVQCDGLTDIATLMPSIYVSLVRVTHLTLSHHFGYRLDRKHWGPPVAVPQCLTLWEQKGLLGFGTSPGDSNFVSHVHAAASAHS